MTSINKRPNKQREEFCSSKDWLRTEALLESEQPNDEGIDSLTTAVSVSQTVECRVLEHWWHRDIAELHTRLMEVNLRGAGTMLSYTRSSLPSLPIRAPT